jgi:DNA-nicking Smr family endonuclease
MKKMLINSLKNNEKTTIDLHGLTVYDAETALIEFLDNLPKNILAVEVTHGYSHGARIKSMIKNDFYHWRVKAKQPGLNVGATWLVLK